MKATATPGIDSSLQTDYILKLLALEECADTIVGNNLIRGVSGGQKKRLTTGEILAGPTKVLFMDEISTGLDTSTTYQIVKCIGQLAHHMDFTILMSLLQPAPETYELFDDILLLSEGHIVYQGPREHILEFFKSCGFECPKRKGAADFLQEVLSQKDQAQYWHNKEEPYHYVKAEEFSQRYTYFHVGQSIQRLMFIKFNKLRSHKESISYKDSVGKLKILQTCFSREILLMKRNAFLFVFKTGQIIFMSFVAMTVYIKTQMHHRDEEDGNRFLSALSFGNLSKWWSWGYWLSPLTYAQNAITMNEFLAPRWNHPTVNGSSLGLQMLKLHDIPANGYWYWLSIGVLLGISAVLDGLFVVALTYIRAPGRTRGFVSKKALEEAKNQHNMKMYNNILASVNMTSIPDMISSSFEQSRDMQQIGQQTPMRRMDDAMTHVAPRKSMSLPFQPLTMSFRNIAYSIDMPQGGRLQLLKGITGAFQPGVLTALMGASGAGKTTLLDVLAGRKTGGCIAGDIRISGYPKKQETFARISGYCEQNDIHSPQVTVYESLIFSASLRLSSTLPPQSKEAFVNDVMELVELDDLRDSIVGVPGLSGLSNEQRKRLTIAVELVANPSIIFMDEPTSGLDARSAAIVMRTIRNAVDTGRTIVCTIHQPSIDIFEAFDELLLLRSGGQLIYAGPLGKQSAHMIHYFQGIPSVPRIRSGYNPATWMLEITSPSAETTTKADFAAIYRKSKQFVKNEALVKGLSVPGQKSKDLTFDTVYAQSFVGQTKCCLWKQHLAYWRSPEYNCNRMLFTLIIALVIGTVFWDAGLKQ
ncbi:hypothetical protein L7F22_026395 [Adiantum nelumboides]|nr:hypothetical protein [Adiantum nelumboides]